MGKGWGSVDVDTDWVVGEASGGVCVTGFCSNCKNRVEPFMEWVTRMDMDMEWISGGYGYFFVKIFGVEWIMG